MGREKISSTLIRQLVLAGEMESIASYLGNEYQTEGRIILRKKHVEVVLHPYYLMPASEWYEVTVNLHTEVTTQIAVVRDGRITYFHHKGKSFLLMNRKLSDFLGRKFCLKGLFTEKFQDRILFSSSLVGLG